MSIAFSTRLEEDLSFNPCTLDVCGELNPSPRIDCAHTRTGCVKNTIVRRGRSMGAFGSKTHYGRVCDLWCCERCVTAHFLVFLATGCRDALLHEGLVGRTRAACYAHRCSRRSEHSWLVIRCEEVFGCRARAVKLKRYVAAGWCVRARRPAHASDGQHGPVLGLGRMVSPPLILCESVRCCGGELVDESVVRRTTRSAWYGIMQSVVASTVVSVAWFVNVRRVGSTAWLPLPHTPAHTRTHTERRLLPLPSSSAPKSPPPSPSPSPPTPPSPPSVLFSPSSVPLPACTCCREAAYSAGILTMNSVTALVTPHVLQGGSIFSRLAAQYNGALETHPIVTKMIMTSCIVGTARCSLQCLHARLLLGVRHARLLLGLTAA
jgi:hypothetical protein